MLRINLFLVGYLLSNSIATFITAANKKGTLPILKFEDVSNGLWVKEAELLGKLPVEWVSFGSRMWGCHKKGYVSHYIRFAKTRIWHDLA